MFIRTEDLLSIRDGEPVDALLRARALADASAAGRLAQLREVRVRLRELPPLKPPAGVWQRIEAEVQGVSPASLPRRRGQLAAAVAGCCGVALAAWLVVSAGQGRWPFSGIATPLVPQLAQQAEELPTEYLWLVAESERLERAIADLPQRQVVNADTVATIVVLEDHIAWLDQQLADAMVREAGLDTRRALWGERVEMMTALLQVRYAQAQVLVY